MFIVICCRIVVWVKKVKCDNINFFVFISFSLLLFLYAFTSYKWWYVLIILSDSTVGSEAGCQSRGCEFESWLGQHSFRRLTKVNVPWVICLSPMDLVHVEKQTVAWVDCCVDYWCEKTRNHMSWWTGCCDMTGKLLKTALNPNNQIKQFKFFPIFLLNALFICMYKP